MLVSCWILWATRHLALPSRSEVLISTTGKAGVDVRVAALLEGGGA